VRVHVQWVSVSGWGCLVRVSEFWRELHPTYVLPAGMSDRDQADGMGWLGAVVGLIGKEVGAK
jgi:hypothetical protein